eukprot:TRINITY_DN12404_c0_g1_i1.p1 TRINITY_DN12404_c0_g1~~TRINITY_DN12404_c0_g1_i1.p1  ORF type:complete len:285 (-),score=185.75 TRINITY_DN12404_c0_g1_i1:32-886(-)
MSFKHPGLYADLGKRSSDLLTKDFPSTNKLELKTKAGDGASFEVSVTKNADDTIIGVVNPKYKFTKHNVGLGVTVDTNRALKVEATVDNVVSGLNTKVIGDTKNNTVTVEADYKHDNITLNGSVDFFNTKGTNASAAAVVGYEGFSVGLQTKYSNNTLSAVNGIAAYSAADYVATFYGQFKTNRVGATYFQRISPRATVAAEASFDLADKSAESPKLTVGGAYDVDPLSAATVKGKFDTDGKLSISYAQRLNAYARLVIGSSFNTNNLSKTGGHNFGFTLSLND